MAQFLKKIFWFSLPLLLLVGVLITGYFYYDPFRVLRPYMDYSFMYTIPNRDYISTESFIRRKDKQQYNAFIFGSSRTLGFKPGSWAQHLPAEAHPFMFDASAESIYGIYNKIKYLDSLHTPIKDALILFCRDVTFTDDLKRQGHLFIKHPVTSGRNKYQFQWELFKAYLDPRFLVSFYYYTFTKSYKSFMNGYIEFRKISYDTITNQISILDQEAAITSDPARYYNERADIFYERNGEDTDAVVRIKDDHKVMLKEIKLILDKNNTHYKIILSPLYEQVKFHPDDLTFLRSVFDDKPYDFTGKNWFTESKVNFYENNHFRPVVGDSIMNLIYK